MLTDVGEYFVGAYLQLIEQCDVVDYNVRPPGGGLQGLNELDVLGLNFANREAILCEVTTHIRGLQYGSNQETVERVTRKISRQKEYSKHYLRTFESLRFQFWSPYVPKGFITEHLEEIEDLELIINEQYKAKITELLELASNETYDARNPVFRVLQILGHMRD